MLLEAPRQTLGNTMTWFRWVCGWPQMSVSGFRGGVGGLRGAALPSGGGPGRGTPATDRRGGGRAVGGPAADSRRVCQSALSWRRICRSGVLPAPGTPAADGMVGERDAAVAESAVAGRGVGRGAWARRGGRRADWVFPGGRGLRVLLGRPISGGPADHLSYCARRGATLPGGVGSLR